MQTINIALIGCGAVTLKAHLPALMNDPSTKLSGYQYRLVAAASLDHENLDYVRQILPYVKTYTDYKELLRESECEAVLIAAGEDIHPIMCRNALESGKYVLCEKPLGVTSSSIIDFLPPDDEVVISRLQIAFNKRFYPAYIKYLEYREKNSFGKPVCGCYHFFTQQGKKAGWDGILSNLIHYCDLIASNHGDIVEVNSFHSSDSNGISLTSSLRSADDSVVSLIFSSSASWNASFHEGWQLVDANRNRFVAHNANRTSLFCHHGLVESSEPSNSVFWLPDIYGYKTQLRSFYDLVTGNRISPAVGIIDALKAQGLYEKIKHSCGIPEHKVLANK